MTVLERRKIYSITEIANMPSVIEVRRVSLSKWYNPFTWGKYRLEWRYCDDPPKVDHKSPWFQSKRPDADVVYQHIKWDELK